MPTKDFNFGSTLKFLIANTHQQEDACSCGVFAIAAATELAYGLDPALCHWHTSSMRQHLKECLQNLTMMPFPRDECNKRDKHDKYISTVEEKIYCICHLVNDTRRSMICFTECGLWFHMDCMGIDENAIPDDWKCLNCH